MNTMEETRAFLESIGQPGGDLYQLPDSDKRFDDGCQYRFEVPGIQSPGVMKALLEEIDRLPRQMREIMLRALEGMQNKEIAADLGISVETVHSLKKIAYRRLRESLKDEYYFLLLLLILKNTL